jgi:amidase
MRSSTTMRNITQFRFSALLLSFAVAVQMPTFAADNGLSGYSEAADIAELALQENERMHFALIHSQVSNKPDLWEDYASELLAFSESDYTRLRPQILDKSIVELQDAVAGDQFDYADLLTFYLYRIKAIETDSNRFLNAIIAINPNALTIAKQRDEERRAGFAVARESLFGIPVLLKDNIGAQGMPTSAGTIALEANFTVNAFVTERLIDSGAVILGKSNLSEWAYFFCDGCPSGYSAIGGQTLNPYGRKTFGTGGSSSGSAAAAAANLATVTVGSETSGSILSPASANSLVGFKPTTGSLSRTGVVPISSTLDTTGPITKTVADAVILFNSMAGFDSADKSMPLISESFRLQLTDVSLQGKKLGVLNSYDDNPLYRSAVNSLVAAGAMSIKVDFEPPSFVGFDEFLGAEMVRDLALYLQEFASAEVTVDSVTAVKAFNEQALEVRAPYGQALFDMMSELNYSAEQTEALRIELQDQATSYLGDVFAGLELDVLLSVNNSHAGLAALANYPALTIPMGYEGDGKPINLTFYAPSFNEQILVDIGLQFEKLSFARRPPAGYSD